MADPVLKLKVDDKEYNASLKNAKTGMQALEMSLQKAGKSFNDCDKKVVEYVRAIGQMETSSKSARGKIGEMSTAFVEMSQIYNKMAKDVQQGDVGKALSQSMEQLKQRTIDAKNELRGLENQLKTVGEVTPSVGGNGGLFGGGKLDGMLQVFGGNLMTKAAGAVASLAAETYGMVQQGIELAKAGEGIRNAFERLGRGDILDGLREATHGTVTDIELMKAAVKFNDFKLPLDELGTMLSFAQQKAKDTGQSVDYMVDSIVTGLGRKSLMILDNLGLSANEVKEKMKETGDMTKAVGAIIREQMSKAGDYVETAADRAAQANVSLQNKMEELGRKFAPLEEASNSLWTSMKIGILDIIGGPLTDLLNKLTQAGRMANAYGLLGGNSKVGRLTANLAGASEQNRQSIYQQQQEQFWRYINPREQQIKDIRAWQSGERSKELGNRVRAITDKYGSLDATKIQAEVDAAKKMLADYQQAAKQILQPIKQEIEPVTTTGGSGGRGGGRSKVEEILPVGSVAALNNELKELQKQQSLATNTVEWESYNDKIKNVTNQIKELKGELGIEALRGVKGVSISGLSNTDETTREDILKRGDQQIRNFKAPAPKDKVEVKLTEEIGKMTQGISSMVGGIEALGVELPQGLRDVLGGIQGVISILTGISTIITAIEAISAADAIIPFARGGIVPHAANGWMVPGNDHADRTLIAASSGELILNRAQQGNLASQLEGGAADGNYAPSHISGEQIYVVLNRYTRRTGKGELVTWRN